MKTDIKVVILFFSHIHVSNKQQIFQNNILEFKAFPVPLQIVLVPLFSEPVQTCSDLTKKMPQFRLSIAVCLV